MSDITIPPAALEAAKGAYTAEIYRGNGTAREYHEAMRAACLAMLRAWPGMSTGPNIYGRQDAVMHLPLPQEGE